ncbi:hypothetical protein CNBH2010 [Cryptococcus deneoformans B-3501A]|uniref:Probable RNA-binding protein 18 n=1 Tax=Cryptococcus deneoformans (strain JEC21 / ATCC MYA-565) TaxID=214684 RepID=Q5KBL5_CRYD1|nr:single-stranded nucleic acid binding protein, putative [Cryptococcus neoformans var. neoformans JEC21]XP_773748.1 hypothetical protein CNBH2010 [Cryptococcus neoformans var. neoformans B-3501A]AAW45689.2 single-stranded nucleic acid binding protein, putative [Cryptococcus neoformans var. neoformans JEC21]EAL19101.1 hypothetical protein CNBH2010 [Cryptococcus neoformans var. neoformans B-3501A]
MQSTQPVASSSSTPVGPNADRLYVGNLSPTVDEFTLIQIFSKYGKITKLDFMFHKTGILKGKPRGFAFIQFLDKADALKAMVKLHDRLLRGRKLVVTYASTAPPDNSMLPTKGRRAEPTKTTTLSLLKSQRKPQSTAAQIAAMEAKLASMQQRKPPDENWIPGSGVGSPAEASNSASPIPNLPAEELLGDIEGEKAAAELEREMQSELVGQRSDAAQKDEVTAEPSSKSPVLSDSSLPSVAQHKSLVQAQPVKKGFASLPKKPVF